MLGSDDKFSDMNESRFGVEFFQPVSGYHKTERSLKYGLLFIVIPFIVFFMFEIFSRRRIHPLQYLMIGLADVFFYLLLLSLSEHIQFFWAYVAGATSVCLLVAFYSSSVLGGWKRGLVLLPVLGGIYAYLYIALESEDYALLVGSIGVFAILATVMIATRRIDWYALGDKGDSPGASRGNPA
jgi:inner membrane protein